MSGTIPSQTMSIFNPDPECGPAGRWTPSLAGPVRETTTEFGYLLRHYWMPATTLRYGFTVRQRHPEGDLFRESWTVSRKPVQTDADLCLWRETRGRRSGCDEKMIRFSPVWDGVVLHEYNRSLQTYHAWPVPSFRPESEYDARNQAMLHQPILPPLLPIPLGFQWYVHNDDGHLNFTLESVEQVYGKPILLIRRSGLLWFNYYYKNNYAVHQRFAVKREGFTVYDLDASTILEDRTCDRVCAEGGRSRIDGIETWTTMKLLRSGEHE